MDTESSCPSFAEEDITFSHIQKTQCRKGKRLRVAGQQGCAVVLRCMLKDEFVF